MWRQAGDRHVFYLGEYATVTAPTVAGSALPGAGVDLSGAKVDAHVVFAGVRIVSQRVSGPGGRTLYYYRTRLGSVVATSVGGGQAGAMYRYGPYGELDKAVVT